MDLYCNRLSVFSHKAKMAFFEKDVSFNEVLVDLFSPEALQRFSEIHPLGKVPCLKTPAGVIPESTAIIEWLDQYYQVPKLIPANPDDARQVRLKDRLADWYVTTNTSLLFFQMLKPAEQQDQERISTARRQLQAMYDYFEKELVGKDDKGLFVHGRQLSMADFALLAGLNGAANFIPLDHHPSLARYLALHNQRPSVIEARKGFNEAVGSLLAAAKKRA
jgi:Glutathione S-transferase